MSSISESAESALCGRQSGSQEVTVRMTGTAAPTSLRTCPPVPAPRLRTASLASSANRKTPFLPTTRLPGWGGAAVFHFQTGCLQP